MFSEEFVQHHNFYGKALPIALYAKLIKPERLGMESREQLYKPTRFTVQVAGGANAPSGIMRIDEVVYENPNWYADMKLHLGKRLGLKGAFEIETVTGRPIFSIPLDKLSYVGKVYVSQNGKRVSLPSLPDVPPEYSLEKRANLASWIGRVIERSPDIVASELRGLDYAQLNAAVTPGGAVTKCLEEQLIKHAPSDWTEFARISRKKSPNTLSQPEASSLLQSVAQRMLVPIRSLLQMSHDRVGRYLSDQQSKLALKQAGLAADAKDAHLFAPLQAVAENKYGKAETGQELYTDIVSSALSLSSLRSNLVNAVYYARAPTLEVAPTIVKTGTHNPVYAHLHHTYLALNGQYPGHYNNGHRKKDMTKTAPFVGDAEEVYRVYHMLSGCASLPPALVIKNGKPIGCHVRGRRPKEVREDVDAGLSDDDEIDEQLYSKRVSSKLPVLVPVSRNALPPLVPRSKAPAVIPINAERKAFDLPDLLPLSSEARQTLRPARRNESTKHIGRPAERTNKFTDKEIADVWKGLPSVTDIFQSQ
jgi:hypothetical protein